MGGIRIITLPTADSTNTRLREMAAAGDVCARLVVKTRHQTAGRGQRGNVWESQPGANITLSMLIKPLDLHAHDQFYISEATALAVVTTLDRFLPKGKRAQIKWPNDIYVDDKKVCGILIEHVLEGSKIKHSILGVGLNVNQTRWEGDAPNPASIATFVGKEVDIDFIEFCLIQEMVKWTERADFEPEYLHREFCSRLWRGDGWYKYCEPDGVEFEGKIESVDPDGTLTLRKRDETLHRYAFKQIRFVL